MTAGDVIQHYFPVCQASSVEDETSENDSSDIAENESRIDTEKISQETSSDRTFREMFMSGKIISAINHHSNLSCR